MKLSPGEAHDRLRRVDSNRRSRSFSKQPSTGDYYKTLSTESSEPRGSRAMAPNEEVGNPHPPAGFHSRAVSRLQPSIEAASQIRPLFLLAGVVFPSLVVPCVYVQRCHTAVTYLPVLALTSCKLPPHFHGFSHLQPGLSTVWSLQSRPRSPNQRNQLPSCYYYDYFLIIYIFLCPARMSRKTWLLPAPYLHCQQEKTSVLWLSPETCLYNLKGLRSGRESAGGVGC